MTDSVLFIIGIVSLSVAMLILVYVFRRRIRSRITVQRVDDSVPFNGHESRAALPVPDLKEEKTIEGKEMANINPNTNRRDDTFKGPGLSFQSKLVPMPDTSEWNGVTVEDRRQIGSYDEENKIHNQYEAVYNRQYEKDDPTRLIRQELPRPSTYVTMKRAEIPQSHEQDVNPIASAIIGFGGGVFGTLLSTMHLKEVSKYYGTDYDYQ